MQGPPGFQVCGSHRESGIRAAQLARAYDGENTVRSAWMDKFPAN